MKPKVFLIGFSFLFLLISAFFLFPSPVKALVNCCPLGYGNCANDAWCQSHIPECCYPNCPYEDWWTSTDLSVCQDNIGEPQSDVCAGSSGVSTSPCGPLGPWGYCYVSGCEVKGNETLLDQCDYQYRYLHTSCGAYDTCLRSDRVSGLGLDDGPYLRAGQCGWGDACDTSGCTYSGIYKTCCQVSGGNFTGQLGGNCTGGCRTGFCPSGSSPVICGVGSCSGIGGTCTTAACGLSACQAVAVAPTPTTPPDQPTPTSSGGCDFWDCGSHGCLSNKRWIQGNCWSYDWFHGNDCYSDPSCENSTPLEEAEVSVEVEDSYRVGDLVEVKVTQKPRCFDNSMYYYDTIGVRLESHPGGNIPDQYLICNAEGFVTGSYIVAPDGGRQVSCYWNTNNITAAPDDRAGDLPIQQYPVGNYTLKVYYGGHSGMPVCNDNEALGFDNTTLTPGNPYDPFIPEEGQCPSGTHAEELDISAYNPDFESDNFQWQVVDPRYVPDLTPPSSYYVNSDVARVDVGQIPSSHTDPCMKSWDGVRETDGVKIYPQHGNRFLWINQGLKCWAKEAGPDESKDIGDVDYEVSLTIPDLVAGDYYLVSINGVGVRSVKANECHSDPNNGRTRPEIKLTSGSITTPYYLITNSKENNSRDGTTPWGELTLKMRAEDSNLTINLRSFVHRVCHHWAAPAAFDNLRLYHCVSDCTCSAPDQPTGVQPPDGFSSWGSLEADLTWSEISNWGENCGGGDHEYFVYLSEFVGGNCPSDLINPDHLECLVSETDAPVCHVDSLSWDSDYCWAVVASNGCLDSTSSVNQFHVSQPESWFQAWGGNVYGHSGISSSIPQSCVDDPVCGEYFSLALDGYSGLISSPQSTSRSFGEGTATESNGDDWSIDGSAQAVIGDYSYRYFAQLVDTACKEDQGENNSFNPEVNCLYDKTSLDQSDFSDQKIVVYNLENYNAFSLGELDWNIGDEKILVFVDFSDPSSSTLTVNPQITVGANGFFALITNGNIRFTQGTTTFSSTTPQVEGVYVADGTITTNSKAEKFVGRGIFFAKGGFNLERDLAADNAFYPSELFLFDPQYLFTAPKIFRASRQYWQEVAP